MIGEHINKKNAGKPRVLAINALLHSLAALAAIFSAAAFISDSVVAIIFWQNLIPAERVTRSSRPDYPPWRVTPPFM